MTGPVIRNANMKSGAVVKVIASQVRKGNVLEGEDSKLYVVLSAENFHPGKGTPTTQVDMRRISDGIKVSVRYKTTDQVERAFVETHAYQYLYEDSDGFVFMNPQNYEQVTVPRDVIGEQAVYLAENMEVHAAAVQRRADLDRTAAARHAGGYRNRTGDEGPDGGVLLQAGASVQRRANHACRRTSSPARASW